MILVQFVRFASWVIFKQLHADFALVQNPFDLSNACVRYVPLPLRLATLKIENNIL